MMVDDSHLAYLLALGFDIDLCRQALEENSTLENATEWILDPNQPTNQNQGSTSVLSPNVSNQGLDRPPPLSSSSHLDLSKPVASASHLDTVTHNDAQITKENEALKLETKKKFEKINNKLKKERQLEREARQKALLSIKEDQEKRKQKSQYETITMEARPDNQKVRKTTSEDSKKDSSEGNIQFKWTNGSTTRQKYPATTLLKILLDFVLQQEMSIQHKEILDSYISLACIFPKRIFTWDDQELNIKDAGFLPNVSLNVVVTLPAPPAPPPVSVEGEEEENEEDEMDYENDQPFVTRVDTDSDDEEEFEDEDMPEDSDNSMSDGDEEMMDLVQNFHPQRGRGYRRPHTWNSPGHRLTDDPPAEVTETAFIEEQETNRRSHMLSAIEQRTTVKPTATAVHTPQKTYQPKSLKDTCRVSVCALLCQHTITATKQLKQLVYASSDLAEYLVVQLIKTGKLNSSTLGKLASHCYLQNLLFDSYTYCTDSLIEDVCKSNSLASITKVSLRGCELITDHAIQSLAKLKHLTYLDLNNCKLTDKGLKSLEKLQALSYLNLSKTKITDNGLFSLIKNAQFKDELQVLLIDGCSRANSFSHMIPIINEFTNLLQLSLAQSSKQSVTQQELINKAVQLQQLDINHTAVTDQDLTNTVIRFKSLLELKLEGCESLTTKSLSFLPLQLKQLRVVQFPSREHELDGVLARYKDLPIEHLDLSSYLNVTDDGSAYIASMKKLRYLNLSGTKLTDQGVAQLRSLVELQQLYLDRITLTDIGLCALQDLAKLETLSLCRTNISNEGLYKMGDFELTSFTRNLRTLNLSQCALVTDRGVKGLAGMANLTHLNLDHTGVSKSCLKFLKDLKYLNPVRLLGIEKEQDEEMLLLE